MPSRSQPRLPPRSLPPSAERSAPCRARRLAGRAGSRHGHPLPGRQGNKTEHTAETCAVCRLPEDGRTETQSGCLVPTTLRGAGGGSDAVRRQVTQIAGPRSAGRERRAQSGRPGSYARFWHSVRMEWSARPGDPANWAPAMVFTGPGCRGSCSCHSACEVLTAAPRIPEPGFPRTGGRSSPGPAPAAPKIVSAGEAQWLRAP